MKIYLKTWAFPPPPPDVLDRAPTGSLLRLVPEQTRRTLDTGLCPVSGRESVGEGENEVEKKMGGGGGER